MKQLILALSIFILALTNILAQDTMYIYRKTNPLLKVPISDIDSVIFYQKPTITDIDGNVYNVITIGGQVWMKENLKVTKYNDGTSIPLVTDNTTWSNLITPGYCFYNNSVTGGVKGALYNWYTVNTGKLCPTAWHVPSTAEWTSLSNFLGGSLVAGGKLKAIGTDFWASPNTGATNETGFSAIPNGAHYPDGTWSIGNYYSTLWASTGDSGTGGYGQSASVNSGATYIVLGANSTKKSGFSVRCLRD